jgi:hypothetical protein
MQFNSDIKVTGALYIKKYNAKNKLVEEINVPNLIVTSGKQYIANRIVNGSMDTMSHMAVGKGSFITMLSNDSLIVEVARVELDSSEASGNTVKYVGVFPNDVAVDTLTEAGLFNAANAGVMLARTTFPTITKLATETIVIEWTISVG